MNKIKKIYPDILFMKAQYKNTRSLPHALYVLFKVRCLIQSSIKEIKIQPSGCLDGLACPKCHICIVSTWVLKKEQSKSSLIGHKSSLIIQHHIIFSDWRWEWDPPKYVKGLMNDNLIPNSADHFSISVN